MTVIVTGASGFLGGAIVSAAAGSAMIAIPSPREGGPDLEAVDAADRIEAFVGDAARGALLIHAAARVDLHSPDALLSNTAMAVGVSRWAQRAGIAHALLVSSVSVLPWVAGADAGGQPRSFYGLGKLTAEEVWNLTFPPAQRAIVRLSGIWGWQQRPSLFWNRLLLDAARGPRGARAIVRRRRSTRNYVSAPEAAAALLHVVERRVCGVLSLAGRDAVTMGALVDALRLLPGSRLDVEIQDDGGEDASVYAPSAELEPLLRSFDETLRTLWDNRPAWIEAACASA
jgi:nucleoside-diphosphate-sugar epimerase